MTTRLVEKRRVKGVVSLSIFTLQSSTFPLPFTGSQWIATGISQCPRDDNALFCDRRKCCGAPRQCHCEEGALARDAAIHRVSRNAFGLCGSVTGSQWIATGISQCPRDDRGEGEVASEKKGNKKGGSKNTGTAFQSKSNPLAIPNP